LPQIDVFGPPLSVSAGASDSGDPYPNRCPQPVPRPLGHRPRDWLAYSPMGGDQVSVDAQQSGFDFVRVGDDTTDDHIA